MRAAYAGKWFRTVTFVQRTIRKNPQTGWRGNVDLPNDFFVAEKWSSVPHW